MVFLGPITAPTKPFASYRWRWATAMPTEGLNEPPIFLGVLRVLYQNRGRAPSDPAVSQGLRQVEADVAGRVQTTVQLDRPPERNLIRNSGQYWKALNLLEDHPGNIILTDFGKRVASGGITKDEFAAAVVRTLTLPNSRIESDADWVAANLSIKPLELVLNILVELRDSYPEGQAYLTPSELCNVVIPLAGDNRGVDEISAALSQVRDGTLSTSGWPNCASTVNDRRMAREFLLFLYHYGYCTKEGEGFQDESYHLSDDLSGGATILSAPVTTSDSAAAVTILRQDDTAAQVERNRVLREVLDRPGQTQFRRNVFQASGSVCLLTGETFPGALQAAHIIPVKPPYNGSDDSGNGLCLRADIHLLFDSGDIRIDAGGNVTLSEALAASPSYSSLPGRVVLPPYINPDNLDWRCKYL